jgi:hypothetical protein
MVWDITLPPPLAAHCSYFLLLLAVSASVDGSHIKTGNPEDKQLA